MAVVKTVITGIILVICMWQDIKSNKIHILLPVLGCVAGLSVNILCMEYSLIRACTDISVGVILTIYSLVSKEKIGLGDCIVIIMLGITMGMYNAGLIIVISSIIATVYMRISKKKIIPFLPSITIAYIGVNLVCPH